MIADHLGGVAVPGGKDGKEAALLAFVDEALHHLAVALGLEDGEQRMERAKGVPQGEVVVVVGAWRCVMKAAFVGEAVVGAVGVADDARRKRGVEERGVEDGSLDRSSAFDLNAAEVLAPVSSYERGQRRSSSQALR